VSILSLLSFLWSFFSTCSFLKLLYEYYSHFCIVFATFLMVFLHVMLRFLILFLVHFLLLNKLLLCNSLSVDISW
jgi:hypothetical protein